MYFRTPLTEAPTERGTELQSPDLPFCYRPEGSGPPLLGRGPDRALSLEGRGKEGEFVRLTSLIYNGI